MKCFHFVRVHSSSPKFRFHQRSRALCVYVSLSKRRSIKAIRIGARLADRVRSTTISSHASLVLTAGGFKAAISKRDWRAQ